MPILDHPSTQGRIPCPARLAAALLVGVMLALSAIPSWAQKRVALVIGNAAYAQAPLRNPVNDARLMASTLQRLGFTVERVENADFRQMQRAIREFGNRASGAEVAFVYYAGHGMQSEGENYLIPIGAEIDKVADLSSEAVTASAVLRQVEGSGARVSLVVLDACRDNPLYSRTRSASRGLARIEAPAGSIVAYAAQAGATADDGPGQNGLYTGHLARYLLTPGLDIKQVFEQTAIAVERDTGGRQRPREDIGLRGSFVLAVTPTPAQAPLQAPAQAPAPAAIAMPSPTLPPATAPATPLTVRIGHVGPTSGTIAHLGRDNEWGARLAIQELNQRKLLIGGRPARFELVVENDASDPRQAVAAAQKLVSTNIHAVVGHLTSGTSIPAAKVYSDAGVPQVSPSATNPRLTRLGYRTAFRMVADDVALPAIMARYAVQQLGVRSVVVVDDRTAYGSGVAESFAKSIEAAGATVVSKHFTSDRATEFSSIVADVAARKPDLVFYGGMDATAGPLLGQLTRAGWRARFMGGDGICSSEFPQLTGGSLSNGQVVCAEAGGVEAGLVADLQGFKQRFKSAFNQDVQIYAPYVYDAVNVIADAMVRAGSAEPARYLPELASTRAFRGVTGSIGFDAKGDLLNPAITLYTYRDSRRQQLTVVRLQ